MPKRCYRCIAGLLIALIGLSVHAAPETLRVVAAKDDPPYLFLGADGQPEGYLVDLWRLWEKKTGMHVVLEPMSLVHAQQAMHNGNANVIDGISHTPIRDQLYQFSPPYASQSIGIFVNHTIKGIDGADSLSGFQIGVTRGSACIDKLAQQGLTSMRAYPDNLTLFDAARSGAIKIFCMRDSAANYYLYLYKRQLSFIHAFTLLRGQLHWAVNRGDQTTFALVSGGMRLITPAERAALHRKWLKQPIHYGPYFRVALSIVSIAFGALLLALLWVWFLRRAVHARTLDLLEKGELLEQQSEELTREHAQLRTLVESSPDAMWLKDQNGVYLDCNARAAELLGISRERVIGRSDSNLLLDSELRSRIQDIDKRVWSTGTDQSGEFSFVQRDGTTRFLEMIKVPILSEEGQIRGVLGVARDITERLRTERELRIASVAFETNDGMLITDAHGRIERVNAAFSRISGFSAADVIGKMPSFLQTPEDAHRFYEENHSKFLSHEYWSGELVNQRPNGEHYPIRMSISAVTNALGETVHYVGAFQDISAEKEARAQVDYLKLFDPLTALPNRALLEDRLIHAITKCRETRQYGAVMMINIDHFRAVNDSLGHAAGDKLLIEISRRIVNTLDKDSTVGRFSADSFVVVLEVLGSNRHVAGVQTSTTAEAIRQNITPPLTVDGQRIACTASIGFSIFPDDSSNSDAETLLRQAELALYKSKTSGRDKVRAFEDVMQAEMDNSTRLAAELREAMDEQQFELFFQPQVDAEGHVIGAEALVRWHHPERGIVGPCAFIPLAEEIGLIEPIGRWVISEAVEQLGRWGKLAGLEDLSLAVNVSTRQFKSETFVDDILQALQCSGASPGKLKLEITESLAIDDFEASIDKLRQLQALGLKISLDDFGTGNSSLAYLTKLPISQLKIDKSFVDALPYNDTDAMVAKTIIAMGLGLRLDVIAEGVESQSQKQFLEAQGCHAFQGYLFGKPMPLPEFENTVTAMNLSMAARWANPQT